MENITLKTNYDMEVTNLMATTDFNVGANVKAARKLLETYVNVGTGSTYEWEIVGKGIEDSSIELNPNTESVTDILGITETSVTKWEPKQSFEPNTVRGGSKLNFKLHDIWQRRANEELSGFDVLTVYRYLDGSSSSSYQAEVQKGCTINTNSIGGSAYVDMPIEISYSNDVARGTVSYVGKVPTFTEE